MRVDILAIGSRGDVQPILALARGLQEAGHQVRFASHASFRTLALAQGVDFALLRGDPQQLLEQEAIQPMVESGRNPLRYGRALYAAARPVKRVVDERAQERHARTQRGIGTRSRREMNCH